MNKINFLEKKNLTYIIIVIFVVFALIHLYKINKQTNEGFFTTISEPSNIADGVFIDIPSLSQVRFGGSGLNTLLNSKADASALNSKADKIALDSKADASALNSKADKIALDSKANSSVVTSLSNTVGSLTTNVTNLLNNNSLPDYTIIEYAGPITSIPAGWQLCDGSSFIYANSTVVVQKRIGNSDIEVNTPNLNIIQTYDIVTRWHSRAYDNGWLDSALTSGRAWHSPGLGTDYMRIQLGKLANICGIVVGGRGDYTPQYIKTLEAYVSVVSVKSINESGFLYSSYNPTLNTENITSTLCKVSNSTSITANTNEDNSKNFRSIMFDTPIIGNFLSIKPLTSISGSIGLRVALLVKPNNNYIIKQPKKL